MSRRALALLAAVLVLALGVAWIARVEPADPGAAAVASARPHAAPSIEPSVELVQPSAKSLDDSAASSERVPLPAELESDVPADARWIAGRVEFPPGTPADERAFVEAHGAKYGGSRDHRFEVERDGTFRAAFAAGSKYSTIQLKARYVYLDAKQDVDFAATEPLVLRPKLGGCLRVTLAPTAIASSRGVDVSRAAVTAFTIVDTHIRSTFSRSMTCDAHGVAEIGGLAPEFAWMPRVELPGFQARAGAELRVEPGRILEHELVMLASPRLIGTVRDTGGSAVKRASLRLDFLMAYGLDSQRAVRSHDNGAFELVADALGKVQVVAEMPGFVSASAGPFDLKEGDVHDGLELVLEEGLAIRGVVRWPDGRVAAGASVELGLEIGSDYRDFRSQRVRTEADGTFVFRGLGDRLHRVEATARSRAELDPAGTAVEWTGSVEAVHPGAANLEIVLRPSTTLRGRVVDDLGAPARGFSIHAQHTGSSSQSRTGEAGKSTEGEGRFVLDSLADGQWKVVAQARTGERSIERFVELPRDAGQELEFVLARAAVLEGRVTRSDGSPAVGASVVAAPQARRNGETERSVKADEDGRFRIEAIAALPLAVHAELEGAAPSSTAEISPHPGETVVVTLALRGGGTILGRVLDERDRPRANEAVEWYSFTSAAGGRRATTQADGTFRFDAVVPGRSTLSVREDRDATTHSGSYSVNLLGESYGVLQASVDVEDGQIVHVDLGGSPKGAIRVRGLVRAREPVVGATVQFFPLDDMSAEDPQQLEVQSDAAGRYEARLTDPGTYVVSGWANGMGSVQRRVEITSAPEQVVDIAFGTARLRGIVLDPEGKALAGVSVRVRKEDGEDSDHIASTADCTTKTDGTFELGGLTAGVYSLVAEPGFFGPSATKGYAPARVENLALAAGQDRDGLELRMQRGCAVVVKVTDAVGAPVASARIEVGRTLLFRMPAMTDSAGMARLDGLEPGPLTISARTATAAEREPARVVAVPDRAVEARITVVPGGRIALRLERSDGVSIAQPFGYPIEVRDADGNAWTSALHDVRDGGVIAYGPMRPGMYSVSARFGAKQAQGSALVSGGNETAIVLREPK